MHTDPTSSNNIPPPPLATRRTRFGTALKMGAIGGLILLLLIPLAMIRSVLTERLARRQEALANITSSWGSDQVICGPVLIVPYKYRVKAWKEQLLNGRLERLETTETLTAQAHFLPEKLQVIGQLVSEERHRGIYQAVVYRGELQVTGVFARPLFDEWKVAPEDILWDDALVTLAITDLRGAPEALTLSLAGQTCPLEPGSKLRIFSSGVHARLPGLPSALAELPFDLTLTLNGSGSLRFAPVGRQTRVQLRSPWPDPKFDGAFLPATRTVSTAGFQAEWAVSYYGRSYPQHWSSRDEPSPFTAAAVTGSLFGVDLLTVVDGYRHVERSIKYGILFLVLVFTAFFLFEMLARLRVHPFQYTLVGMALCLFYLALLSLAEVISFGLAYLVGAAVATLLIVGYSAQVLRSFRRALLIGGELAAIYGCLFVILRLQDYALLFGTAGLFLALGVVMFVTRKIDWYAQDEAR
ncbi:MAG: cell envelope integrity protein CreD [Kiritimatiellaeota bacterium]|nr:cell envelope integrity protein CreD [Kiritimatiellota bacterium]